MRALSAVDFVDSYMEAWNHHDPRWIADHLTRDGVYCDIPLINSTLDMSWWLT